MVSAPSISVPVECVNICKFFKGDGSGRYDCSAISCAGKAPRALTGFLASTTHSSAFLHGQNDGNNYHRCEVAGKRSWLSSEVSDIFPPRKLSRSSELYIGCRKWVVRCSSSSPSGYDELSPELLWEDLKPAITYLTCDELELVHDAFKLAFEAHDGQKRRSGEPFIIHPVEVARILGELELDWESIAAGLLHDTVEDTNVVTFERIEKEFGVTVRHIVEGETKVSKLGKLKCKNEIPLVQDVKAHDLRQMFLAMTEEASHEKKFNTARFINTSAATSSFSKVRVIIVKLADRLHNMRTLSHMPLHKQSSIASETLQVFAPLAKLLGMYQIKSELENLSFMYTNPQDYGRIKRRVAELYNDHEKEMEEANKLLIKKIEDDQFLNLVTLDTEVRSVCKEPYSIYKSVLKSRGSINEVNQIAQLRIIVKPKPGVGVGPLCNAQQICYHVLGLVHGTWTPIPRAMKDYIATPKPNGYQSLHTIVIPFLYESTFRLEVQIRTEEMNLIANRGIAAHYSGKVFVKDLIRHTVSNEDRNLRGKTNSLNNANVALRIGWLNAIREWQEEFVGNMSSREFVDTVTKDLLGSRVFVFTPRGEIKNLPKGATVIDYAYMIHTEIGNKMVAAKVNGNLVPPLHVLANAEVVEIVTYNGLSSKTAFQRHKQWLQHAKTRSARHKIMKFLREQAVLSASEITADSVNEFVADTEDDSEAEEVLDYSKGTQHTWEKILKNVMEISSSKMVDENLFKFKNGTIQVPKVNGNHNKHMQQVSLKTDSQGNELGKMMLANIPMYKEVLPSLESWLADKVASWSNLEGHSIQWLCIVCIDRKGMMADTTIALADAGIGICSCAAEVDRVRGMAVILFHVDASLDNMASACSRMDLVLGVLGWSTGCTWPSLAQNQQIREC